MFDLSSALGSRVYYLMYFISASEYVFDEKIA